MPKIMFPKNPHGMVIFGIQLRRNYRNLRFQVDPAREIEFEVTHISIKTEVSVSLKSTLTIARFDINSPRKCVRI